MSARYQFRGVRALCGVFFFAIGCSTVPGLTTIGGGNSDADAVDGATLILRGLGDGGTGPVDAAPVSVCGNGVLEPTETCDDGNLVDGDGCSSNCQTEAGYTCVQGASCAPVCGDSRLTGNETCDDGNQVAGDGCSASCMVESGWTCPYVGAGCIAASCGDGIIAGSETCDDGNHDPGDGCDANCHLESGFTCPTPNTPCRPTVCGDDIKEGTEQCDDGNTRAYDGCSPTCTIEPVCSAGAGCAAVCGDGVKYATEQCDDGNTKDGDGCSSTCTIEAGFGCSAQASALPNSIDLPIVFHDFKRGDSVAYLAAGGHPDFETYCCDVVTGLVGNTLDSDDKPIFLSTTGSDTDPFLTSSAYFAEWYRDDQLNIPVLGTLHLKVQSDQSYVFDSATDLPDGSPNAGGGFWPLDGLGWMDPSVPMAQREAPLVGDGGGLHNFSFTSEVHLPFTYSATDASPKLTFTGDDDVWVFVNGYLAVDIGGVHGIAEASVTIDPTCAGFVETDTDHCKIASADLGLSDGGIYEIAVFQAERHLTGSNYKLTVRGFVKQQSVCAPICGDGIKTNLEVCDDGSNNDTNVPPASPGYNKCSSDCLSRGPYCGDGHVDALAGEVCDDGTNVGAYGGCMPGCKAFGPHCGDGIVNGNETCDDGNLVDGDGCDSSCHIESTGPA